MFGNIFEKHPKLIIHDGKVVYIEDVYLIDTETGECAPAHWGFFTADDLCCLAKLPEKADYWKKAKFVEATLAKLAAHRNGDPQECVMTRDEYADLLERGERWEKERWGIKK